MYEYGQLQLMDFQDSGQKQKVPFSIFWLLLFVAGAIAIAPVPGLNFIAMGLGALAFFAFLFYVIRAGFLLAPEFKCLILYFLVATLAVFMARNLLIYIIRYLTMLQILLMFVMVLNYARSTRSVKLILFAVLLGSLVVGVSAVFTGEYARSEYEGERAAGFAMNANSFATTLIFAAMITLYFFKVWRPWFLKAGLIALLLIFGKFILASGSRKGFIGFMATLFLWFIFSYATEIKKRPSAFVIGLMVVIVVMGLFYVWSRGTIVERRFESDVKEDVRLSMYIYGMKLILSYPILGIGLDQYNVYAPFETYSHSNYIDVFCNAGVFAGIIYYLIYILLFIRLWKLGRHELAVDQRELVAIGKMYIILRFMLDFVVVSYFEKSNWIFFAILIGWSYSLEQQIKRSNLSYDSQLEGASEESMEVV